MIYHYLELVKTLLQEQVATAIRLKKPFPDDVTKFELVSPAVTIGWPPRRLESREARRHIPGIAIGLSEPISDTGDERLLPIDIAVIVFNAGSVMPDGSVQMDDSGFHDLLELMDIVTRCIRQASIIGGCMELADRTIRWSPMNEPIGDYWLGNILFTLSASPIHGADEQEIL